MAGWLHNEINVRHRELNPDTVAHISTNRVRRRLTSLMEVHALTITLRQDTSKDMAAELYKVAIKLKNGKTEKICVR